MTVYTYGMDINKRLELMKSIASGISAKFEQVRLSGTDTGTRGGAAEDHFITWMNEWMPKKIGIADAAVIAKDQDPTDQMDAVLYDVMETPIWSSSERSKVIPIEGVLGAVEINSGVGAKYEKIIHDYEKLSRMASYTNSRTLREPHAQSHITVPEIRAGLASQQLLEERLCFHFEFYGKPLLIVFAEDIDGSLQELAKRTAEYNLKVGVNLSVDGIFILKKGFILHLDNKRSGWVTTRMTGCELAYLECDMTSVLVRLQSIILMNLYLMHKINPGGFDLYLSSPGQMNTELANSVICSNAGYSAQPDGMFQTKP